MHSLFVNAREDTATGCIGKRHEIVGADAVRKALKIGAGAFALGEQRTSQSV
jgi:hypothetical protein